MIDTLNFQLDSAYFDYNSVLETFKNKMDFKVHSKFKYGSSTTVNFKNYKFSLTEKKLTAKGSLTKLYHGNNIETLTYNQMVYTLNEFESIFGFPFDEAVIRRIDIGKNILVDNLVYKYLDILTAPSRYKVRLFESETKYFESGKNKLLFYDKSVESLQVPHPSRYPIPMNLLRYEISFSRNLVQNIGVTDVRLKSLYDKQNIKKLLDHWYNSYKKVPKLSNILASQINYSSMAHFKKYIISEGIKAMGGIEVVQAGLRQAKTKKNIKYNIREYLSKETFLSENLSPLLKAELDSKIDEIYYNEVMGLA